MNVKLRAGRESEPSAHSDSSVLSANLPRAATHWLTQTHTAAAEAWLGGPETGTFGEVSSVCSAALKKKKTFCAFYRARLKSDATWLYASQIFVYSVCRAGFSSVFLPPCCYIYTFFFYYYYFRGLVFAVSLVVWSDGLTGCGCARAYDRWWSSGMCAPRAVCCCQWERKREGVEGVSQARAAHGNIRRVDRRVDSGLIMISCFF